MDNGKCSKCLASSYGRLTKFGIIVVSVVVSVIAGLVPLYVLRVGMWCSVGLGPVGLFGPRCYLVVA